MRFFEFLAASSAASLVAAHSGVQGAPKLFGLPGDIKIRTPSPRAARAAAAQGPHYLHARQGGDANNRCGPSFGNARCAQGYCCSGAGYCGNTPEHCNAPDCLFNFGPACDANKTPAGASTRNDARPQKGSVQYGGAGIYACRKPGTVAITYDDGPYVYTNEVLNKFAAAGFKATFFITGNNIGKGAIDEKWAPVIRRMISDGHQVASHTWSHQDLSAITEAQVYDQMVKNEMAIRNIIGKYPTYMRPPYSSCNPTCQNVLRNLGYVIAYFDLDTDDYNQLTREKIEVSKNRFRSAVNAANPSSQSKLAIAHDIHELTALNLTVTMIETLQARGFRGVTMGECMNEPEANWYRDSTPGTPNPSTTRTSAGPTSTPTGAVSTDGTCGPQGNNRICLGSSFGNCCSQHGWCGSTTAHCGTGCNSRFGTCGNNANPSSAPTSSSSTPRPTGSLKTSVDGTCGGNTGNTCIGFVHEGAKSECCSQYGYCGASTGHCGTGCNPLAGKCGSVSSSVSSSVAHPSSASTSSSAAHTPSITSTTVPSSSTSPSVSTDKSGDKSSTISSVHPDSTTASQEHQSSTISSVSPSGSPSVSKQEDHSSTISSTHPDVTSSASEHESNTISSVHSSSSSIVPTHSSQTSSVYADDHSTAQSSSTDTPVASSTGDYKASSTADASVTSPTPDYLTTLASSVKPASTSCTTSSTPIPTPTKAVSKDGKCGGENGQTCAGYKNSFGFKLECCCKTTGRCSADPWACTAGCDKKNGKCWY